MNEEIIIQLFRINGPNSVLGKMGSPKDPGVTGKGGIPHLPYSITHEVLVKNGVCLVKKTG